MLDQVIQILQGLAFLAAIAAAIYTALQVKELRKTNQDAHDWNRRKEL